MAEEEILEEIQKQEENQEKREENGNENIILDINIPKEEKGSYINIPKNEKIDIVDALRLISPGTPLRTGIDEIMKSRKGAIIVIESPYLEEIVEGGFKVNCKFSPQRLFELSKMDGALVLSSDLKRIMYANSLLVPNPKIPTDETGTRHKAADRTAKQAKTIVIAISERRNTLSLYYYNIKYSVKDTGEILSRTMEELQILEKQKEVYNNLLSGLNTLEISGLVSKDDISSMLQRIELMSRISDKIKGDIAELGVEANLVKIRFREMTKGIEKDKKYIFKDYFLDKKNKFDKEISKISLDNLLEISKISDMLFNGDNIDYLKPKGYRILDKMDVSEEDVDKVIVELQELNRILESNQKDFEKILKDREKAEKFSNELSNLKNNILLGHKI